MLMILSFHITWIFFWLVVWGMTFPRGRCRRHRFVYPTHDVVVFFFELQDVRSCRQVYILPAHAEKSV